ncbi:MAG: thioredoxin domain-containing protein [Actinomycetales bacterium]|nr:thioredoxin domain-containing protein [Actinomycetales bacterium]
MTIEPAPADQPQDLQSPHDQSPHDQSPHDQLPHDQPPPGEQPAAPAVDATGLALARLRQGIILGFILVAGLGIASLVLVLMTRQDVTALAQQLAVVRAAIPSGQPAPAAQPAAPSAEPAKSGLRPPVALKARIPSGADDFGALLIGDPSAARVVEVFVDFQCPFCQRWDRQVGARIIDQALTPGSGLLVKVNPLAFLGETSATLSVPGASARAANAAACIRHADGADVLARYITAIYEVADPSEPPGQFPPDQLVSIAAKAGAGKATESCIRANTFIPYVAEVTRESIGRGVAGTPTVLLDGTLIEDPFTNVDLASLVGT